MGCVKTLRSLNMMMSGLVLRALLDLELFLVVSHDFKFGLISLSSFLSEALSTCKNKCVKKLKTDVIIS
jgi:hypothetical protein